MCDAGMPWLVVTIVGTFIVILCELKKLSRTVFMHIKIGVQYHRSWRVHVYTRPLLQEDAFVEVS